MEEQSNPREVPLDITLLPTQPQKRTLMSRGVRPLTFMLLGFLLAVTMLVEPSKRQYRYIQGDLPEVVAPVGQLAEVYETARPASLQIEAARTLMLVRLLVLAQVFLSLMMVIFLLPIML